MNLLTCSILKGSLFECYLSTTRDIGLHLECQGEQDAVLSALLRKIFGIKDHFACPYIGSKGACHAAFFHIGQFQLTIVILDAKVKNYIARIALNGNIQCDFIARIDRFCFILNGNSRLTAVIRINCQGHSNAHCKRQDQRQNRG